MTQVRSGIPRSMAMLLVASIAFALVRNLLVPNSSAGGWIWVLLLSALSLSIWVGKPYAAKALGCILCFLGFAGIVLVVTGPVSWSYVVFTLIQSAVYLATARQLFKSNELSAFLGAQSAG